MFEVEKIHLVAATAMHPAAAAGNKQVADSQNWANAFKNGVLCLYINVEGADTAGELEVSSKYS